MRFLCDGRLRITTDGIWNTDKKETFYQYDNKVRRQWRIFKIFCTCDIYSKSDYSETKAKVIITAQSWGFLNSVREAQ